MKENNSHTWKTKHGTRRVRQEKPTLSEAIIAARDLSDEVDAQVEIAAALMGLPQDQVRAELLKQAPEPKEPVRPIAFNRPVSAQRTVVVEYKRASRR
jgi:hypothetical protein